MTWVELLALSQKNIIALLGMAELTGRSDLGESALQRRALATDDDDQKETDKDLGGINDLSKSPPGCLTLVEEKTHLAKRPAELLTPTAIPPSSPPLLRQRMGL